MTTLSKPAKAVAAATRAAKADRAFSADERAAMKERAKEAKSSGDGEADIVAKIAEMGQPDRGLAERVHKLIKDAAPDLVSKTWYGMPAYAKGGKTICFFQPAEKFKARYATLGFNDGAALDEGSMWPVAFAITRLTAADEKQIAALVRKAAAK